MLSAALSEPNRLCGGMGVSGEQAAQRAPEAVFRPSRGGRGAAGSPPPHGLADASAGKEMDELFFNPVFIQTLPQNALTIFLAQNPRRHARQGFLRNPSSRKIRNTLRTLMFSSVATAWRVSDIAFLKRQIVAGRQS